MFNAYAATAVNWRLMAHAAAVMGGVVATAYETLSEDGLQHSLAEPECKGLFTNAPLLPTLLKVLPRSWHHQIRLAQGRAALVLDTDARDS